MSIRNIANVSLCLALLSVGNGVAAQNESRWHNVDINQQNREPRRAAFFAYETLDKHRVLTRGSRPTIFRWKACGSLTS